MLRVCHWTTVIGPLINIVQVLCVELHYLTWTAKRELNLLNWLVSGNAEQPDSDDIDVDHLYTLSALGPLQEMGLDLHVDYAKMDFGSVLGKVIAEALKKLF